MERNPFSRLARDLEGEAHPGLEALEGGGAGFEQRTSAERRAVFLEQNRLRRTSRSVNADKASRIGEEREQTVRRDRERPLDYNEVERPAVGGAPSREPSTTTTFARPLSSARAAANAPKSVSSMVTFAPMALRSPAQ